jgi:signal transduction histidine kinase
VGGVRLSVSDRGPGLPPGGLAQLFVPYSRAPEAGISGIDGTGLGLAIVKPIVDLRDGTVGAHCRCGGGFTFWFELPFAPVETMRPATRTRDDPGHRSKPA